MKYFNTVFNRKVRVDFVLTNLTYEDLTLFSYRFYLNKISGVRMHLVR